MKLLVDMNLSPRWVDFLRSAGREASHWSSVGRKEASDAEIMAYAKADGSVVLTHDLDFSAILAATHAAKPSVVQIRADDTSPEKIGSQVLLALKQMADELEEGVLLTIDPKQTRIRILPLKSRR